VGDLSDWTSDTTEPGAGDRLFVERGPAGRAAWAYFLRADTMHSLYTFLE
jgi:hypothetical protein